jgi:hypothetical protein
MGRGSFFQLFTDRRHLDRRQRKTTLIAWCCWFRQKSPVRVCVRLCKPTQDYNSHTKDKQERALSAWMRDPGKSKAIETMIEQHRENTIDRVLCIFVRKYTLGSFFLCFLMPIESEGCHSTSKFAKNCDGIT